MAVRNQFLVLAVFLAVFIVTFLVNHNACRSDSTFARDTLVDGFEAETGTRVAHVTDTTNISVDVIDDVQFVRLMMDIHDEKEKEESASEPQLHLHNHTCYRDHNMKTRGCLPNFVIFGVPKSATSSFYQALFQHPKIISPVEKETFTFNGDLTSRRHSVHPQYWAMHFGDVINNVAPNRWQWRTDKKLLSTTGGDLFSDWESFTGQSEFITGDGTVNYIYSFETAIGGDVPPYKRIQQFTPNALLICLLRNPVDRAYSSYKMWRNNAVKEGRLDTFPSFESVVNKELDLLERCQQTDVASSTLSVSTLKGSSCFAGKFGMSYVYKGVYADHLIPWLTSFPRQQFFFFTIEEWSEDPLSVLRRVENFLGLPEGKYKDLKARYNGDSCHSLIQKCNKTKDDLDPVLRAKLATYFKPHNQRLSRLLSINLAWDLD